MHVGCSDVDGPEENSSKLLSTPFVEDPQHRLKWTAYLEFTHNNEVGDLTWDKVISPDISHESFSVCFFHLSPLRPQLSRITSMYHQPTKTV